MESVISRGLTRRIAASLAISLLFALPDGWAADIEDGYAVKITGVKKRALRATLYAVSDTVALKKKPPPTLTLLGRRAERDVTRMMEALRANGYYDGRIDVRIRTSGRKVRVTFAVKTGPPFRLESVDIQAAGGLDASAIKFPEARDLELEIGERLQAGAVLDAEQALLRAVRTQGYPFPRIEERSVTIDHATRTARIVFRVDPGPTALFGSATINGLARLNEQFVRNLIPWKEGRPYNEANVDEAQKRLIQSGLFSTTRINSGSRVNEEGALPMTVELKERRPRSVSLGVGYKTDEGYGSTAAWEHRNLFGRAERLSLKGTYSENTRAAEARFKIPQFLNPRQSLILDARIADDDTEAYDSRNVTGSAIVERELTATLTLSGGGAVRLSRVDQLGDENSYLLLSLPIQLDWNTSDDLLDPSKGGRLCAQTEPMFDVLGEKTLFFKNTMSYSHYLKLAKQPDLVLAGRTTVGSLSGSSQSDVPPDVRFYSGGGGSIRGYAYQQVGPLDGDKPLGGLSLAELSVELRVKATERLGFVTFLDGGTAFEGVYGNTGENLLWGAGVGLRYFTVVGPLRLDVGFPLNRRDGMDDRFQVYVSIGQAF